MYNKIITVDPARPNFPLDPLWSGAGSDCLLDVYGIPEGFSALFIFTHSATGSTPMAIACETFVEGQEYRRFEISGLNLNAIEQMTYEIVAYIVEDGVTTKTSCGRGYLNVTASDTTGTEPIPAGSTVPINLVYNLTTGKLHRQYAEVNELGEVTLVVDPTPVN
jgi:hypothetical protein